jgi:hypothetical protein
VIKTWHKEAAAQAIFYLAVIYAQFGTLIRQEIFLAMAMWWLGRAASRTARQNEKYARDGIERILRAHAVECAQGTKWDLRIATVLFALWGVLIGSWLTLADVLWTLAYIGWRKWRVSQSESITVFPLTK